MVVAAQAVGTAVETEAEKAGVARGPTREETEVATEVVVAVEGMVMDMAGRSKHTESCNCIPYLHKTAGTSPVPAANKVEPPAPT